MRMLSCLIVVLVIGTSMGCQTRRSIAPRKTSDATVAAADGVTIAYDVRGSGNTAIVFVHGWCSDRTFWREQLDVFASDYRVVAIDLPGHGSSGRTRKKWSLSSFAGDVSTVVESLDLKRVVLIGHSMGGLVSLEAAQLQPDRVIGIIGIDTISDVESEGQPEMMDRVIAAFEADFEGTMHAFMPQLFSPNAAPELVQWATNNSVKADHVMALEVMRGVSDVNEKKLLSLAKVPVRVIYADSGDSSDTHAFVKTNRKYADFDAVFVQGVGHFLHLEDPDAVNHHLRILVTELEQEGSVD
jgi:pimeloyl-ACP methyl ester carboxylesterase